MEIFQEYLVVLGLMIVGLFAIPGIFTALFRSIESVLGYSNPFVIGPESSLGIGVNAFMAWGCFGLVGIIFGGYSLPLPTFRDLQWVLGVGGGLLGVLYWFVGGRQLFCKIAHRIRSALTALELFAGGLWFVYGFLAGWLGMHKMSPFLDDAVSFGILAGCVNGLLGIGIAFLGAQNSKVNASEILGGIVGGGFLLVIASTMGLAIVLTFLNESNRGRILFAGIGALGIAPICDGICFLWARRLALWTEHISTPLMGKLSRPRILCEGCLQYSQPSHAQYEHGQRYCEHCDREVLRTHRRARLALTFGLQPPAVPSDVLVVPNPNFQLINHSLDVTDIYIDVSTCERHRLEQCITYLLNYPPVHGIKEVYIFHSGELQQLGDHLHNVLRNTFAHIQPLS